jgi:hypothetical protein
MESLRGPAEYDAIDVEPCEHVFNMGRAEESVEKVISGDTSTLHDLDVLGVHD